MSTAVVKAEVYKGMEDALQARLPRLARMLPATLQVTPDHVKDDVMLTMVRNPVLFQCTHESVIQAMYHAAQLGLRIGLHNSAHLVPFRDSRSGSMLATLIPGYNGLIDIATRDGRVRNIEAHLVCENDEFDLRPGSDDPVRHRPALKSRGEVIGAYAVAHFREGGAQVEWMSIEELEAIRSKSRAKNRGKDSPAYADPEWRKEMYRKGPVRRICKYVAHSFDMGRALMLEDQAEAGEPQRITMTVEPDDVVALPDDDQTIADDDAQRPGQPPPPPDSCAGGNTVAQGALPRCPECGGEMWDNTEKHREAVAAGRKYPAYKCKAARYDKETQAESGCSGVWWSEHEAWTRRFDDLSVQIREAMQWGVADLKAALAAEAESQNVPADADAVTKQRFACQVICDKLGEMRDE